MHREAENSARIQQELRSELVMALETHHPPAVGWRIELHNRGQELEATKRELLVARRLIDSLRKGESQQGLETREDNMGSVGRGFPGYTPSPAGSAVPETLFTAGFESVSAGFPSFPGLTPPPPVTELNGGQSSSAGLTNLGGSVEKEVGAHEDPALSRKPKDRVRRSEPPPVEQLPPPAQQEGRDSLQGGMPASNTHSTLEEVQYRDRVDQPTREARSHYGPGIEPSTT